MARFVDAGVALACVVLLTGCGVLSEMRAGWPDERRPRVGADAGTLVIQGKVDYGMLGGLEGNQPFVKAVNVGGQRILEQHFQWPTTEERLPPGRYTVNVYTKPCDGSCAYLDALDVRFRCEVAVAVRPARESVIVVDYTAESLRCAVTPA